MDAAFINALVLGLFVVGCGVVAVMVTVTQRSYKQDEKSPHWVVYPGAEGGESSPGGWEVILYEPGARPVLVIEQIREITGLGPAAAGSLIDELPSTVLAGVDHSAATAAQSKLARAGAGARMAEAQA
ncbi:ribosomal protein L7/L12 [Glycomyces buryatensis]|uniref:Ribosomal protein L7/L12 n=1 Tax=Glycomyces buryatensis TaxID=2570927 RepID=A0A4V6T6P2_9ACTN|nr:ribosomal protein L7/L12 [Glycomyces buryatensis]THV40106.1 ribosomal protein L7/L12 [Glycomyces buryatensis]